MFFSFTQDFRPGLFSPAPSGLGRSSPRRLLSFLIVANPKSRFLAALGMTRVRGAADSSRLTPFGMTTGEGLGGESHSSICDNLPFRRNYSHHIVIPNRFSGEESAVMPREKRYHVAGPFNFLSAWLKPRASTFVVIGSRRVKPQKQIPHCVRNDKGNGVGGENHRSICMSE